MRFLKRLYDWVLHWANTPYGMPALFLLAFAESSFFPIPPDVLLIALGLSIPKKAFKYAAVCTIGSVLGGVFGYFLGWQFWELAKGILFKYIDPAGFEIVRNYFIKYEAWAVSIAGFTPIPYKGFYDISRIFKGGFYGLLHRLCVQQGSKVFPCLPNDIPLRPVYTFFY